MLRLANEFKNLIGFRIISVYTQEKDTLMIELADEETNTFIEVSTENKYSSIFLRNDFSRAKKNTVDLFPKLKNEFLQDVEILNRDRIIKFSCVNFDLICLLFGRGSSNIILVDKKLIIRDSLENKQELAGTIFKVPIKTPHPDGEDIWNYVSKSPHYLGSFYAKEFFISHSIDKTEKVSEIDKLSFENTLLKFKEELIFTKEFYNYRKQKNIVFSMMKLTDLELISTYDNIHDAIRNSIITEKRESNFNELFGGANSNLNTKIKKARGKVTAAENWVQILERVDKYRKYGELLISQPNPTQNSGNEIKLNDWEGNELTIPLDEKLNLIENSTKYFEKAKKSEKDATIKEASINAHKEELGKLESVHSELQTKTNYKELSKFIKENNDIIGLKMDKRESKESKFRHFEIDGYDFYVGKNAANNDELTMKFAKPNDFWFHARGVGGSHCVLRIHNKDRVPKDVMKKCARLSAYYSQARKGKYVPVVYTEKKYVRKPKGANVGAVILQKEDVIMVDPVNPEDL